MASRIIRYVSAVLFLTGFAGLVLSFAAPDIAARADRDVLPPSEARDSEGLEASYPVVYSIQVQGVIGPVIHEHIKKHLVQAEAMNAEALVLEMHTPGGLLTSTRDITQTILSASVPVVVYVSPPGAHAASAGTYILYASHIAAMAPGTNIGAATPVAMGTEGPTEEQRRGTSKDDEDKEGAEKEQQRPSQGAMAEKAVSDASAYIRGLAEMRGRNADWAEKAVREASSLTAAEAIELNVIEIVAEDLQDLVVQMHGRTVKVKDGVEKTLDTKDAVILRKDTGWRVRFLQIITDPNVAFLLMTLGGYGLIYEFANPGTFVPGVIGVICLVLGLFAMNVLPVNYAGVILILLGLGFMAGEAVVPSFGVLGIGGAFSFAMGATILYEPDLTGVGLSWWTIGVVTGFSFLILTVVLAYAIKGQRGPVTTGKEGMLNSKAEILKWANGKGDVRVSGEIWSAVPDQPRSFRKGEMVKIVRIDGLKLVIAPVDDPEDDITV